MAKDPYKYFRVEARELLGGLSKGVLELERGALSKEVIKGLLRLAHTLKGAARVVKLPEVARQAHQVEDLLAPHREGEGPIPEARIEELLRLLDAMDVQLVAIDPALDATAHSTGAPSDSLRGAQEPLETVRVEIEEMDLLLEGVTEARIQINALRRESETIDRARYLAAVLVEQLRSRKSAEPSDANVVLLRASAVAEELRNSIERVGRGISSGVEQVSRELAQVRDASNRLRLLPASTIFSPLERAVRDAAQLLRRNVVFLTSGGDGRLDAHVLAALRDALLHVVRNAVAHGIESEADRVRTGKPAIGRVHLEVVRRGDRVAFVCRDDGQGIDVVKLRHEAARVGLLSPSEASSMAVEDLFRLLLQGGLTTTRAVTEVSGRGVGLDVVREAARRLHGEVIIKSDAGLGTTIEICVPVSLSSLAGLVVDAASVGAVLPLDAVRRTLRLADADIARASERETIVYEGKVIPFVPLAKALGRPAASTRERRRWSAVVVQSGSALAAVGVDRLLGTATAVVRRLPRHIDVAPIVAGASLDAEGNPQLVLDPSGLVLAA
jgi:two-component system, chemotaxis family, sensor kinase CheA